MDPGSADEGQRVIGANAQAMRLSASPADPGAAEDLLQQATPPIAVWASPEGEFAIGAGLADEVVASGPHRCTHLQEEIGARFDQIEYSGPDVAAPRFFGGLSFTNQSSSTGRWSAFPESWFFLPQQQYVEHDGEGWMTAIGSDHDRPTESNTTTGQLPARQAQQRTPSRAGWLDQVDRARKEIQNGEYEKVVLAHSLTLELTDSVPLGPLVRQLRQSNASCFVSVVQPREDTLFVSATPERLVTRHGSSVRTDALAGSAERGSTTAADDRLSSALAESEKDRFEHELVVDSITDRLRTFGGTIDIGERRIKQLSSVQHLHTPIRATYPDPPHVLELVDAIHPTPAVGGHPRTAALGAIDRIETIERGWYAAPIGWVDAAGDGSFAIGIRSGVIVDDQASLFAGAGIVADSIPDEEWAELQLKYRPILDTFPEA